MTRLPASPSASRPPQRSAIRRNRTRAVPTKTDRLSALGLSLAVSLLRLLSVDRASALMGWCWRRFAPFDRRHQRADDQLAQAMPALKPEERRRVLAAMWDNLGRTAAESLLLPAVIADRSRFDMRLDALEADPAAFSDGVIFASLHQGNWELAAWGARLAGFRVAAVYRPLANPLAETFLRARRESIYDAGLYPSEGASAMKLFRLARDGAAICLLADLRDTTGIVLPFLGRPAHCATFPAVLARRLGRPLVAGRVVRTKGAHFRMEVARIEVPETADTEADIAAATAALNRQFEAWIRAEPGQWMWAHRKWAQRRTSA